MSFFFTACLLSWFVLFPVSGQLILHTKAQITRHHRHHHSHHAPSAPEWIQALQRAQQPLGVLRTDIGMPSSKTPTPEASEPGVSAKVPTITIPMADIKGPKVLSSSPRIENSDVLVSVFFTSIPRWPKNGEQMDLLVVPLGKWTRPGRTEDWDISHTADTT